MSGLFNLGFGSPAEPTKGELLAEKYERRFNRATDSKNYSAAFAVANDIAAKMAEAAESVAAGGDPMAFLHRYDQGCDVIGYSKDTARIEAALASLKACDALAASSDMSVRMAAQGIRKWAMAMKSGGANNMTAAMVNPGKMFKIDPRPTTMRGAPASVNQKPSKWPAYGGKPGALRNFQRDLVEA